MNVFFKQFSFVYLLQIDIALKINSDIPFRIRHSTNDLSIFNTAIFYNLKKITNKFYIL